MKSVLHVNVDEDDDKKSKISVRVNTDSFPTLREILETTTTAGDSDEEEAEGEGKEEEEKPKQYIMFPPLTPEDVALTKMVDLQKMGRSHKHLPIAPDGYIPNSQIRKLYNPIDTSQQLVPINATKLDLDKILKKSRQLSSDEPDVDAMLQASIAHYLKDEKMREISFVDTIVEEQEKPAMLTQRINSDEVRRDVLDLFYEKLGTQGPIKTSAVGRKRQRIDGKGLKAEKRRKLLNEKRRRMADLTSHTESTAFGHTLTPESPHALSRHGSSDGSKRDSSDEDEITLIPISDDLDDLPFEERIIKMLDIVTADMGSTDAAYHMVSRILEEDPKAWYHMKMALSRNDRVRYFVDGIRHPRFACGFLSSMFGSVVQMMDTVEGAIDGVVEDLRLVRLMLNSAEKTEALVREFSKARSLAQAMLTDIIPASKNIHFLLRDALRSYTGAVEALAVFMDNDMKLTETFLHNVLSCNIKALMGMRQSLAAAASRAKANPFLDTSSESMLSMTTPLTDSLSSTLDIGAFESAAPEVAKAPEHKSMKRSAKERRKKQAKRKLPPLPKFSEAAWKAHLANRLNAAIETCAETTAIRQVAAALKKDEVVGIEDFEQEDLQGVIMSVFESHMLELQSLCDTLGARLPAEALLNSAMNMQREALMTFLNGAENNVVGMQLADAVYQAKESAMEHLMLASGSDDARGWDPVTGLERLLHYQTEVRQLIMTELQRLKADNVISNVADMQRLVDAMLRLDDGALNAVNECIMANRHPLSVLSPRMAHVTSMKLTAPISAQLAKVIEANKVPVLKILASSLDLGKRCEREAEALRRYKKMLEGNKELCTQFLINTASRFDVSQLLHSVLTDRFRVLDFVRSQDSMRHLDKIYESMDKVEALIQKAQRMTKISVQLHPDTTKVSTHVLDPDEQIKETVMQGLKELQKRGIHMSLAALDDSASCKSYQQMYEALEGMPISSLQDMLDYMKSDEWKSRVEPWVAQPLINEMKSALRHLKKPIEQKDLVLVKEMLLAQVKRMIIRTEHNIEIDEAEMEAINAEKTQMDLRKAVDRVKEILGQSLNRRAMAAALSKFFLTDEFKVFALHSDEMLSELEEAFASHPPGLMQTFMNAVAATKLKLTGKLQLAPKKPLSRSAKRKEEAKKKEEEAKKKEEEAAKKKEEEEAKKRVEEAAKKKEEEEAKKKEEKEAKKKGEEEAKKAALLAKPPDVDADIDALLGDKSGAKEKSMESSVTLETVSSETSRKIASPTIEKRDIDPKDVRAARQEALEKKSAKLESKKKPPEGGKVSEEREVISFLTSEDAEMMRVSSFDEEDFERKKRKSVKKKRKSRKLVHKKQPEDAPDDSISLGISEKPLTKSSSEKTLTKAERDKKEVVSSDLSEPPKPVSKKSLKKLSTKLIEPSVKEESEELGKKPLVDVRLSLASTVSDSTTTAFDEWMDTAVCDMVDNKKPEKKKSKQKKSKTEKIEGLSTVGSIGQVESWGNLTAADIEKIGEIVCGFSQAIKAEEITLSSSHQSNVSSKKKVSSKKHRERKEDTDTSSFGRKKHNLSLLAGMSVSGSSSSSVTLQEPEVVLPNVLQMMLHKTKKTPKTKEKAQCSYLKLHRKRRSTVEKKTATEKLSKEKSETETPDIIGPPEEGKTSQAQMTKLFRKITTQPWFTASERPSSIGNVCRSLCELLNNCKNYDTFKEICEAIILLYTKYPIPPRIVKSMTNFFNQMLSVFTKTFLPKLQNSLKRTTDFDKRVTDPIATRRKKLLAMERFRDAFLRTLKISQVLNLLSEEDLPVNEDLREYFFNFFRTPETTRSEIEEMTEAEMESLILAPQLPAREMTPFEQETLGRKSQIATFLRSALQTPEDEDMGLGGGIFSALELDEHLPLDISLQGKNIGSIEICLTDVAPHGKIETFEGVMKGEPGRSKTDGTRSSDVTKKEAQQRGSEEKWEEAAEEAQQKEGAEGAQQMRASDADEVRKKNILEEDSGPSKDFIRSQSSLKLKQEQQESMLPGEDLDNGLRRVISLIRDADEEKAGVTSFARQRGKGKSPKGSGAPESGRSSVIDTEAVTRPGADRSDGRRKDRLAGAARDGGRSSREGLAKSAAEALRQGPESPRPIGQDGQQLATDPSMEIAFEEDAMKPWDGEDVVDRKEDDETGGRGPEFQWKQLDTLSTRTRSSHEIILVDKLADGQLETTTTLTSTKKKKAANWLAGEEEEEFLEDPSLLPFTDTELTRANSDDDVEACGRKRLMQNFVKDERKRQKDLKRLSTEEKFRRESVTPISFPISGLPAECQVQGTDKDITARLVAEGNVDVAPFKRASIFEVVHSQRASVEQDRAMGKVDADEPPSEPVIAAEEPKLKFPVVHPEVTSKDFGDESKLARAIRAIPIVSAEYKPRAALMKRLPNYMQPDVAEAMRLEGRKPHELSAVASVAEGSLRSGKRAEGTKKTAVPDFDDPMFQDQFPIALPYLTGAQPGADSTADDAVDNIRIPLPAGRSPKKRRPIVPLAPPCSRPSYVTPHDWGRIAISREAWRSGKYRFDSIYEPGRHCEYDELSAKNLQQYGVSVGKHLVRKNLVKMISASIHETARERIEKRLVNKCDTKANVSSVV